MPQMSSRLKPPRPQSRATGPLPCKRAISMPTATRFRWSASNPKRILGFMPNFRSVSGGAIAHPPGWKYNFGIATHQAFDYSSFLFLGITSLTAEGIDSHPALGKGVDGFLCLHVAGLSG